MENTLGRFNWRFRLFPIENVLFRVVLTLSGWLKKRTPDRWEKVVSELGGTRAYGLPATQNHPINSFSSIQLEARRESQSPAVAKSYIGSPIALPQWTQEILPFLANQLSSHTRRAYETDLKQFFHFLEGRIAPSELRSLKPEHIILFRKQLEEGRLTGKVMEKSSINRKLAVVKSFLNWLKLNQVVSDNPAQLVKGFPQTQESALKGLSDEEVRKTLELPKRNTRAGALHHAILTTLFHLGIRKGELIGLKVGDFDSERGIAVLKVRGKGHRIRILPVTPQVKSALDHYFFVCRRDWSLKEEPLFTPTKNPRTRTLIKPLNPHSITYLVARYAKKAGILKQISPHSCRATCISNALDRRATHRSVQHLAGWSTPLMIQRYDKRREDLTNSAAYLVNYNETEEKTG